MKRGLLRHCFLLVLCLTVLVVHGQVQQGIVKSVGRPGKPGKPLSNVTIRLDGQHNSIVSEYDGSFAFLMYGMKDGDAYSFRQIQKKGYELNEKGVIGRRFAFSTRVPVTIVMISMAQLEEEKQRIENNAFAAAERNYQMRLDQLEKQKNEQAISIEH